MSTLKHYFEKMSGGAALPPLPKSKAVFLSGLGAGIAIALGLLLEDKTDILWIMAPFGASCFLAFALPDSPLAQPRNIIFGHLISTFSGLFFLNLFGQGILPIAISVAAAVCLMLITRTSHAPAGADPLLVFALQPGWNFLVTPVLLGSLLICIVALLFNNLRKDVRYPKYW